MDEADFANRYQRASIARHFHRDQRRNMARRMDELRGEVIRKNRWSDQHCLQRFHRERRFIKGTCQYVEAGPYFPECLPMELPRDWRLDIFSEDVVAWGRKVAQRESVGRTLCKLDVLLEIERARAKGGMHEDTALIWILRRLDRTHHAVIDYKLFDKYLETVVVTWDDDEVPDHLAKYCDDPRILFTQTERYRGTCQGLLTRMVSAERALKATLSAALKRHGIATGELVLEGPRELELLEKIDKAANDRRVQAAITKHEEAYKDLQILVDAGSSTARRDTGSERRNRQSRRDGTLSLPLYLAAQEGFIGGIPPAQLGLISPHQDLDDLRLPTKVSPVKTPDLPCFAKLANELNSLLGCSGLKQPERDSMILDLLKACFPWWFGRKKNDQRVVSDGKIRVVSQKKPKRKNAK